jgi:hypothetical protein
LAQKSEFFYTPVRADWLNMVEIEFSAIASREVSESEVLAIVKEREEH